VKPILTDHKKTVIFVVAMCGVVQWSIIKYLHHQQRNFCRGMALLVYLNTFAGEMSEAHSDRLLKNCDFCGGAQSGGVS